MPRPRAIVGVLFVAGLAGVLDAQRYTPPVADAGRVDFAVSCLPEALPHAERGVALLHSFWYDESRKAFGAAADVDPDCGMAWWGQAMTWTHPLWDPPTADELEQGRTAARAARDIGAPTPRERAYIDAVQHLYSDGDAAEHAQRMFAYERAMDELARAFPDDRNAVAFHALAVLGLEGGSEYVNERRAATMLVGAFGDAPDHPGAVHYLIHAYDNPEDVRKGLGVAAKYPAMAAGIPHALHMPSHLYVRLGMWDEAVAANEAAWRASEAHASATDGPRDYHSLLWLHYGYLQVGRRQAAADVRSIMRAHAAADEQDGLSSSARGRESRAFVAEMAARDALERGDWAAATRAPDGGSGPAMQAMGWYVRGLGAARALPIGGQGPTGALAREAAAALDPLAAAEGRHGLAEMSRLAILAAIAAAQEEQDEMTILLAQATALEDAIASPGQPTSPLVPVHELAGELWLRVRRYPDAIREFEASLARYPRRARSMIGLATALARQGETAAARRAYTALVDMWSQADADLPELVSARQYLQREPSGARSK